MPQPKNSKNWDTADDQQITLEQALDLARQQLQLGNYRVAELALTDILKAVPGHFHSQYFLGLAKYHLGNLTGAIRIFREATDNPEVTAECWCNFGALLAQAGEYDEALKAFEQAIKLDANYPDPYWNKSNTLWMAGRYEEAEKAGREAVNRKPESPEAWLNLGTALVSLGRREKAVACWEKALERRPDFALALNNLGNALREMGRIAESEEKCRKALEIDPKNAQAMNNLANALLDQSRFEKAEEWYRKAVSLKPDYAEAHNNLAVCLIFQMRYEEAITEARYATLFQARYAEAYTTLSNALRFLGRFEEAEQAIQQAVLIKPESSEIRIDLADLLLMRDRYADAELVLSEVAKMALDTPRTYLKLSSTLERANKVGEALEAIDKAVALNPEMPEAYLRRGQIYHIANQIDKAEESYRKAAELQPDIPLLHVLLAELSQTRGELEKSKEHIRKAQALSPHTPAIYTVLAKLNKFTKDDADFKAMLAMEKDISRRGPEAEAALHFSLFSAYEDIGDYDTAFSHLQKANARKRTVVSYQHDRQVNMFKAIKDGFKKTSGGDPSDMPVFILGMPRSGTTLTEQIIAAHPDVYGAGELHEFTLAQKKSGGAVTDENAGRIGAAYVAELKKLDPSGRAKRITDKMPGNFLHIGDIVSALPNAKIIHCRRDPIDTCLSCYKQSFARGQYWSYDQKEIAAQYKLYEDLMDFWREKLPGKFLDIDYEDTVSRLEAQARKLIDYIGLPWNEACLEPHKHKRAVLTASKMQVIQPVYTTSVKAWKRYEMQLQPLIEGLKPGIS